MLVHFKEKGTKEENPKQGAKVKLRNGFEYFCRCGSCMVGDTEPGTLAGLDNLGRVTFRHLIPHGMRGPPPFFPCPRPGLFSNTDQAHSKATAQDDLASPGEWIPHSKRARGARGVKQLAQGHTVKKSVVEQAH